ncbi:GGDEF domain-containing protein [Paenibacillus sp. N3.4]|nr:GGDEF domain-containing protein [Paenibacillus sp. N3.4]
MMLVASYQSQKKSLMDTTLTLNFSSASKMSQTIDSLFKSMRSSLYYSANIFTNIHDMNEEEVTYNLELMRHSSNYFNSITIVDETGLVRNVSPKSIGSAGKYITTDAAKTALALQKSYLSKPYIAATGRLIVFMSEPIYDKEGTYRGFIGGTLYLEEYNILSTIFGNNLVDKIGSYFYIVGSDGHILYHRDNTRLGENISANSVVQKLIQGQSGYELAVNLKGEALLAGYVKVPENGWGVVVVSPILVINEQLSHHIKAILLYTIIPFSLLMLIVILLARRLAQPFVSLANLVSKIGSEKVEFPEGKQHWNREADWLSEAIRHAFTDVKKQTDQLTHEATTDPLTGLTNRRTLETIMHKWIMEPTPFSVVLMDIDYFKSINDTYGHQIGDEVLKHFANIMTATVRPSDVCCRFGGEEFIALLPHRAAEEAYLVAERIRHLLETNVNCIGNPITVSLGISHFSTHADSAEELIHLADQALYKAKTSGRNQTIIAEIST